MAGDENTHVTVNDDARAGSAAVAATRAPIPAQRRPEPPLAWNGSDWIDRTVAVPSRSPELDPAPLTATVREVVDFIGRGIAWPMRVDQSGSISLTNDVGDLDASVQMILQTAPGERLMRPEFGCRIHELVFEPVNANTLGLMKHSVQQALAQWEPRIRVEDVEVEADPNTSGLVTIRVWYRVLVTNDRRNLVYPFYTIPHEGEPIAKGNS